ncbi:MAG: dynamin family protein [Pseudanabaenaceae cyanobacterium bins.39]|nr:dynamin family protein [Pseudanabaenaceae cyanobacterium bins.39]
MTFENLNFEVDATGIVAKLRAASGLTQREFAERIGMNQSQLARIESGKQFPKIETLAKIASGAGYALQIHFLPNTNEQIPPISIIFGDTPMADSSDYSVYFASIQQGLLSERENFLWVLHDIRSSLRSRNIHPEVIPNYLGLAKACHDQCLGKSWTLIDIIEESSKNGIAVDSPNVFTSLFDILKDERRKYKSFFTDTQGLASVLQEQQDIGNVESKTVRVISNHLEVFEKETEDELLEYAESHPSIRFAAIKLVIPEHSIRELNDYDDKQLKIYRKALDDARRKRKKVLDKLEQFDRLLAYRKSEIRMSNHLVASYADRLMRQQQSEFIGKSIMEPKMNTATNLDEVRQQAIAQLEALQKYLNEKGRIKEAEDISKEVTKLRDNTYQIAFVATFSAGKSTLINAMLGNDILPSMAKPTTGRLTFINDREGDVDAQVEISKKGNQRVIILSYRDPQDLQKYLNKYLRNGWIGKAEVYSEEKSLQFDSPVNFVKSVFDPVSETNDIHSNQARLTLNKGYSSFSLTDLSQVELGSFINNDAVKELKIYAPVKHLTKQVRLEGIQFVDTPGTNSARHADHKRITFDFIDKANAVVYVINFTTAFTESDALLLEEIRRQRQYNSRFCDKLFFAVNKIDQDNGNSQTLQDSISSIHNTLNNDYGFDLPRERVIGVAALPALLYRMEKENLLNDDKQNEVFDGYVGRFLSLRNRMRNGISTDSISEAMDKVLQWSNIEALETELVKYLSHNNKTQELVLDAIRKGLTFLQAYEQDVQQKLAIFKTDLENLKKLTEKFAASLQEAGDKKKLIAESLLSDQEALIDKINSRYKRFKEQVKTIISDMFDGKYDGSSFKNTIAQTIARNFSGASTRALTSEQWELLKKAVDSVRFFVDTSSQSKVASTLENYSVVINDVVRSMYNVFESELKSFCNKEQTRIYKHSYSQAEAILRKLNQDLNEDLGIPKIENPINIDQVTFSDLTSIRDIVNSNVYETREESHYVDRGTISKPDLIISVVFSINPQLVKSQTVKTVDLIVINGTAKASEIVKSGIASLSEKIYSEIDRRIDIIEQNLANSIQERKSLGDNVLPEIERLETDLDSTRQAITSLNEIYKFTENLQTNSIN